MAEAKVLSGAGLRGQVAGQTALSTVGQAGAGIEVTYLSKGTLSGVHDVNVLSEENNLAHRASKLCCVVGSKSRLGLTNLANHGEDVLSGLLALGLIEFLLRNHADKF